MAKEKKPKTKKAKSGKGGGKLLTFLLLANGLVLTFVIQYSFIFLLVALLPSVVAHIVDRTPGKHQFHTVLACNIAGLAPYMSQLLMHKNSLSAVQMMLSNPLVWFMIYSAAAIGWLMVWLLPYGVSMCIHMMNVKEILVRENLQKKLVNEWGPELKRKE